jgi:hypothetical protein
MKKDDDFCLSYPSSNRILISGSIFALFDLILSPSAGFCCDAITPRNFAMADNYVILNGHYRKNCY